MFMSALGKNVLTMTEGVVDIFEFNFARSVVLAVSAYLGIKQMGEPLTVDRDFWPALMIRTVIGTLSFLGVCVGMQLLPLSI